MKPGSNGAVQQIFQHNILLLQWSYKMGHGIICYLWAIAVQLQHHVLYDCSKLNKVVLQNTSRLWETCSFSHNCQLMSSKIPSRTNLCPILQMLDSRVPVISLDTKFMHDPIESMRGIKIRDFCGVQGLTVNWGNYWSWDPQCPPLQLIEQIWCVTCQGGYCHQDWFHNPLMSLVSRCAWTKGGSIAISHNPLPPSMVSESHRSQRPNNLNSDSVYKEQNHELQRSNWWAAIATVHPCTQAIYGALSVDVMNEIFYMWIEKYRKKY